MDQSSKKVYKVVIPQEVDLLTDTEEVRLAPSPTSYKNIDRKVKLLEEIGFDKDFVRKAKSPKICIADFYGSEKNKRKFLGMAGYLQAYSKMKEEEKVLKYKPDRKMGKPGNPYLMDLDAKRRVVFEEQRKSMNNLTPLLVFTKSNQNSPRNSQRIEFKERKPSDLKDSDFLPEILKNKSSKGRNSNRDFYLEELQKILDF